MAAVLELEAQLDNLLATAQKETSDIDIFQLITKRKECPICMLPIPLSGKEITFMYCCGKFICTGCIHRAVVSSVANDVPEHEIKKCAFCRQQKPKNDIKALKMLMKKDNNSQAFMQMSFRYKRGEGIIQSNTKALQMATHAAELGEAEPFATLGTYYEEGIAVELNMSKALEFYEVAAKKGSIPAHRYLAEIHSRNGNVGEGVKHYKVAASAGDKMSMGMLMDFYKLEQLSKEELAKTLRAHQASLNEMKSKEREDAHAFMQLHSGDLERLRNR